MLTRLRHRLLAIGHWLSATRSGHRPSAIAAELADLLGQLVEIKPGALTLHYDRATLRNVLAQLKNLLTLIFH